MSRFGYAVKYWIISLGLFLMFCFNTHAQLRLVYNENFVSNKEGWPTADETTHSLKMVEGHYELKILNTGSRWVYAYPSINPKTYFIIEIKVKIKATASDYAFGVIWNVEKDGKNLFKWSKNGNLHAEKMSANVATAMGDAKTTKKFDDDAYHIIKVKSFSNRCEFYIDDELVQKTDHLPYKYGNGVGTYVSSTGTAEVDYIRVYQEREPINLIETDFKVTDKQNLGSAVNTHYSEVQPIISHDGNTLFFTRKAYPKNVGGPNDDVWYSNRDANNTFSESQNLGKPINNTDYNCVAGFSADGKKVVAFGKYSAAGASAGDGFCEFTKTASGWGSPKNLDIKNYYNLNEHCEASYSPDGSVLILTIERRDSYGGKDIYISLKQADGSWSAPFNGGALINSYADEISPFLAGDNKTLYFASEGHSGYGSSDVFMTRRLDDTWKNWSKPVNMGPVINSHEWDAYFTIDAKGDWAYMVSNNHSIGKTDIFRFKIPQELKPDSVAAQKILEQVVKNETVLVKADSTSTKDSTDIKTHTDNVLLCTDTVKENNLAHTQFVVRVFGKAYDAKTKQVLPVPIVIRDMETHNEVYTSCGEMAGYDAKLAEGSNYDIYANYTGYIVEHTNVDLTTIKGNYEKQVDLYLTRVEKDETVVMNNIFFEEGSAKLRYDSRGALLHIANLLKENPKMTILIGGHTQMNTNEPKFNLKLSNDRAKEVFQELIKMGAARKQMNYKGFGNSKPLYDTKNVWENAKNGRVDFTILTL